MTPHPIVLRTLVSKKSVDMRVQRLATELTMGPDVRDQPIGTNCHGWTPRKRQTRGMDENDKSLRFQNFKNPWISLHVKWASPNMQLTRNDRTPTDTFNDDKAPFVVPILACVPYVTLQKSPQLFQIIFVVPMFLCLSNMTEKLLVNWTKTENSLD